MLNYYYFFVASFGAWSSLRDAVLCVHAYIPMARESSRTSARSSRLELSLSISSNSCRTDCLCCAATH